MGRRLPAGKGHGLWPLEGGHPRWPQIVLVCPDGVNPAARPDPDGGDVREDKVGNALDQ